MSLSSSTVPGTGPLSGAAPNSVNSMPLAVMFCQLILGRPCFSRRIHKKMNQSWGKAKKRKGKKKRGRKRKRTRLHCKGLNRGAGRGWQGLQTLVSPCCKSIWSLLAGGRHFPHLSSRYIRLICVWEGPSSPPVPRADYAAKTLKHAPSHGQGFGPGSQWIHNSTCGGLSVICMCVRGSPPALAYIWLKLGNPRLA